MAHSDHPFFDSQSKKNLIAPGRAFAIAFLFLVLQYTFKLDFQCPCNSFPNEAFFWLYVLLPFAGFLFVLTFISKTCAIVCESCSCFRAKRYCCRITRKHILRNIIIFVLWIITVFIDGDALVCFKLTDKNITNWYDQIPCKKEDKLTAKESNDIRYYQALSQVIGLVFLCITPLVCWGISMSYQCKNPLYKSLFEDLYEKETMRSAEREMRKMIKQYAIEKCPNILQVEKDEDWKNFSDKLVEFITEEDPVSAIRNHLQNPPHPQLNQDPPQPNQNPPHSQLNQDPPQPNQDPPHAQLNQNPPQPNQNAIHPPVEPGSSSTPAEPGSSSTKPESSSSPAEPGSSSTKPESSSFPAEPGSSSTNQNPSHPPGEPGSSTSPAEPGSSSTKPESPHPQLNQDPSQPNQNLPHPQLNQDLPQPNQNPPLPAEPGSSSSPAEPGSFSTKTGSSSNKPEFSSSPSSGVGN